MQPDNTTTHCPECRTSKYMWREVNILHLGDMPHNEHPKRAIEIYCANCKRTLSITPILE